jgi:membrane glycosyltransferase
MKQAAPVSGFVQAVVDPVTNALACASGAARLRPSDAIRNERGRLVQAALVKGPKALSAREQMTLLNDPLALSRLHFQVWVAPEAAPVWANAGAPS